jgi:hypothetical protein
LGVNVVVAAEVSEAVNAPEAAAGGVMTIVYVPFAGNVGDSVRPVVLSDCVSSVPPFGVFNTSVDAADNVTPLKDSITFCPCVPLKVSTLFWPGTVSV